MELKLKFAPTSEVRRYNVARFDPGLPPFGAHFRQPGRSFHEVVSDEEQDEEQMRLREKEDREREALKQKGGARNPDEWRMKGMREDATDVSWIVEDSSNSIGYSGKLLPQKRAQYVVMVARKQSQEVLVMPVDSWFKFDRQTKKRSAERRLQEQRARTNFQGERTTASRPKSKPSALDLIAERTGARGGGSDQERDEDGLKLGGDDDTSQQGASDVDDGMEFDGGNSDDDADARIGAMGKRESESDEGEPGRADDAAEGKGRLGRKFAEQQNNSDSDLDAGAHGGDGGFSDSDGEAGRSYHKVDSNTWGSDASGGSDLSSDELAKVEIDEDDIVDGADLPGAVSPSAAPASAAAAAAGPPVAKAAAGAEQKLEPPQAQAPRYGASAPSPASAASASAGGQKRARESPPPAERPAQKKPSLMLNRPKNAPELKRPAQGPAGATALPALKLEEAAIASFLQSRKVSTKVLFAALGKDVIKSKQGQAQLKVILKKLNVKTVKDEVTKEAYLVLRTQ